MLLEVRMLGPLQVRRTDGSVVADGEWRSSKTLDLLRLLALRNGEPVSVESVLLRLWPEADETRGRASLRTAASQLRKILRSDCVRRRGTSLVLSDAWVDVTAFENLVAEAGWSRQAGDHDRTVRLVEEADALYVGDLDLPAEPGEWLTEAREALARDRARALLDAAESAAALHWMRDSLTLAEAAAAIEPSERAVRTMMAALAGIGEMGQALDQFERLRRDLAQRFGVDPSPQTRALHLQLLTGNVAEPHEISHVGHERELVELAVLLAQARNGGSSCGLLWVRGEPGSGRDSLVRAACREAGLSLRDTSRDAWASALDPATLNADDLAGSDVVLLPQADTVPDHAVETLTTLARRHGGVLVVPVRSAPAEQTAPDVRTAGVDIRALDEDELQILAETLLQGTPSPRLLRRLRCESGGRAGTASRKIRDWLATGRVVWSTDGLELDDAARSQVRGGSARWRRSLRLMSAYAEDIVSLVAVAGRGVPGDSVISLVRALRPAVSAEEVLAALNELVSAGHLVSGGDGYGLRDGVDAEVLAWMRPHLRELVQEVVDDHMPALFPVPAPRLPLRTETHGHPEAALPRAARAGRVALSRLHSAVALVAVHAHAEPLGLMLVG